MINKKSWIRTDKESSERRCPFGLPITKACQHAGSSVTHMCPLDAVSEDKKESIQKANQRVYVYQKDNSRCIYAAAIMEKLQAVNCDFGDSGQGMHMPAMSGSPLYPQTFSGIGLDGLYAFPLGFYADNNESRNLFQGLFSLVGEPKFNEVIKKIATTKGEIFRKLENGDGLSTKEMLSLLEIVEECRNEYEEKTNNPAKVVELEEKWNSRVRG